MATEIWRYKCQECGYEHQSKFVVCQRCAKRVKPLMPVDRDGKHLEHMLTDRKG